MAANDLKMVGARRLGVHRNRKVRVYCALCQMKKQYDGNALIERLGPDFVLPDLLRKLGKAEGCETASITVGLVRCGLRYAD